MKLSVSLCFPQYPSLPPSLSLNLSPFLSLFLSLSLFLALYLSLSPPPLSLSARLSLPLFSRSLTFSLSPSQTPCIIMWFTALMTDCTFPLVYAASVGLVFCDLPLGSLCALFCLCNTWGSMSVCTCSKCCCQLCESVMV